MTKLYFDIKNTCPHCGSRAISHAIIRIVEKETHETILFSCGAKLMVHYNSGQVDAACIVKEEMCKQKIDVEHMTLLQVKEEYGIDIYNDILKLLQ